jgi:hypothetical protein
MLWEKWNIADHERLYADPHRDYIEEKLVSPGAELAYAQGPCPVGPPALSMSYSICSRLWRHVEEYRIYARIGEIFAAKDGTGHWDTRIRITYAMERVDTPYRWKQYYVHHLPTESFIDVIREHTQ